MVVEQYTIIQEKVGGEPYSYYPLGEHIVVAPGICGGRPTFKYTRLEVSAILSELAAGRSIEEVVADYHHSRLSVDAVREALQLASQALLDRTQSLRPTLSA